MSDTTSARGPLVACAALVLAGLAIAAIGGLTSGSILGGVVAAAGAVPAAYGAWKGMQQQTQTGLAGALLALLGALAVGGILVVLALIDWAR